MRADTNEWMRVCDRRRVLCADVCMNVCTSVCVGSVHRCVRVSAPASPAEGLPPRLWGRARLRPSPPQISSLGSCSSSRWGRGEGLAGAEGPGGFFSKWPFSWLRRTRPYAEDRRSGARGVASIPSSSTAGEQSSDGARQRLQDLPAAGLQVPPAPPRPGGRRGLALGKQRPSPPPPPAWGSLGGGRGAETLQAAPGQPSHASRMFPVHGWLGGPAAETWGPVWAGACALLRVRLPGGRRSGSGSA